MLFNLKDHFKESKLYLNRTVAAVLFVCVLLLLLLSRLIYLQIIQHDIFTTLSRNNQVRIVPVPPTRGLIYDRNGVLLAENVPTFSLEIIPNRVKNLSDTLNRLTKVLNISLEEKKSFLQKLRYKQRFEAIPLRQKLSEEEVARFSIEQHNFPGVDVVARLARYYPEGSQTAHILGYIGPISEQDLRSIDQIKYRSTYFIGKTGIEKNYEHLLHGEVGYQNIETDARGRVVRVLDTTHPLPGKNLHLAIDIKLQRAAFKALGKRRGAVVAIEPKTGEVITMVSNPSYNPNLFVQGIDSKSYAKLQKARHHPLFDRAIKGQYPPGSTVKPLVAIRGLETETITPKTRIFDPGWYQLKNEERQYRDWKRIGHGWTNLEKALAESCTTYFFHLAHKLGIDHLHDVFDQFGLGQTTGIDLLGEAEGLAPSSQWKKRVKQLPWYPGETLNTGIGQGYTLATPLQVANAMATIANRGSRYQPIIVSQISENSEDPSPAEKRLKQTITLNNPKNWDIVIRAMEKVIQSPNGTAYKIHKNLKYSLAGKTGTAQVFSLKQDEEYESSKIQSHLRDHSWFAAFAPVNEPSIAIAVIIENDHGASLVARELLDSYFGDDHAVS